jgi:cAMP-dependent protein kinase regulator
MRLADLKTQALRYVVIGDLGRALRCYAAAVAAVPSDLEARTKIADLLVSAQLPELAKRVYAAVAFYDIQGGRPLHAVVVAQALSELGAPVGELREALAQLYGAGSPKLGKGARLSPPDPATDIPPPSLTAPGTSADAEAAAAIAANTSTIGALPELFPPVPLLSELGPHAFARVLSASVVRRLPAGTRVISEGDAGQSFFLVAAGQVRVFKASRPSPSPDSAGKGEGDLELARLGEGAVFGEHALVAAEPRTASVEVIGEADLIELGADALRAAAGELAQLAEGLHRFVRDRLIKNLLHISPLFQRFSPDERLDLIKRFSGLEVAAGEVLVEEGEHPKALYIVLLGELIAVSGPFDEALYRVRAGDIAGEVALLSGKQSDHTLKSIKPTSLLSLPKDAFSRLLLVLPELRDLFTEIGKRRGAGGAEEISVYTE